MLCNRSHVNLLSLRSLMPTAGLSFNFAQCGILGWCSAFLLEGTVRFALTAMGMKLAFFPPELLSSCSHPCWGVLTPWPKPSLQVAVSFV